MSVGSQTSGVEITEGFARPGSARRGRIGTKISSEIAGIGGGDPGIDEPNARRSGRSRPLQVGVFVLGLLAMSGILIADDGKSPDPASSPLGLVTISSYLLAPISILILYRIRFWKPFVPPAGPLPTPWRLPATLSLGLYLASIFGGIAGVALASTLIPDDADVLLGSAGMMWGGVVGIAVVGVIGGVAWRNSPLPEGARPPVDLRTSMITGVIAALLLIPIVQATSSIGVQLQIWLTGVEPSPLGHETLRMMADSTWTAVWWLMAGAAVIGAPVVEEVMYRGMLQQSVRKLGLGPIWASFLVGGFFSLMHLSAIPVDSRIGGLLALLVLGTGLGLLREWTGRLDACILLHGIFNLVNLLLALTID